MAVKRWYYDETIVLSEQPPVAGAWQYDAKFEGYKAVALSPLDVADELETAIGELDTRVEAIEDENLPERVNTIETWGGEVDPALTPWAED